jgi:hypothetical protein
MWFFSLTRARNTHFGSPSLPFRYFLSSGFQRTARGLGLTGSHTRQGLVGLYLRYHFPSTNRR